MSRQKKTRRLTRYQCRPANPIRNRNNFFPVAKRHVMNWMRKPVKRRKKRKHKGLDSGSRHSAPENKAANQVKEIQDPRLGSRKKVPLMVEFVNKPQKAQVVSVAKSDSKATLDPMLELEQLENNECLNQLLDQLGRR